MGKMLTYIFLTQVFSNSLWVWRDMDYTNHPIIGVIVIAGVVIVSIIIMCIADNWE